MDQKRHVAVITKVLLGDNEAYALLVDAWKAPIFNLTYRMTGSLEDADDLAQETFLKAFESLAGFDTNREFFPWLYSICLNCTRNHLKKKKEILLPPQLLSAHSSLLTVHWHEAAVSPEQELISEQEKKLLHHVLLTLPPESREAVVLRFFEGLPFDRIGEILDISPASAKMRVYRALEKMRRLVMSEERAE